MDGFFEPWDIEQESGTKKLQGNPKIGPIMYAIECMFEGDPFNMVCSKMNEYN